MFEFIFSNKRIKYLQNLEKYSFDGYLPDYIKESINSIPKNSYVLCPVYNDEIQLGITGKRKIKESAINATKREINEEVGFSIIDDTKIIPIYYKRSGKRVNIVYMTHISNIESTKETDILYDDNDKDIVYKRVGIFIYANRNDEEKIKELFETYHKRPKSQDADTITSCIFVPLDKFKDCFIQGKE